MWQGSWMQQVAEAKLLAVTKVLSVEQIAQGTGLTPADVPRCDVRVWGCGAGGLLQGANTRVSCGKGTVRQAWDCSCGGRDSGV